MPSQPDTPDFKIDFSMREGVLRALVRGHNGSLECTLGYWRAIAAEARLQKPAQLLVVDMMDGGVPPPEDLLSFVQSMLQEDLQSLQIAYVEDKPDSIPKVELAGIYAHEHGFRVQIFDTETAATRWLRYGET